ncbi:4-(cytidine 5'-diphospho)-2-C-methyl-D-erythritol kinase [Dysgonomonas sp. Marseille-P4677]|uniref:4-(cytidine 5'-diphospho)-2-C-methyl-D-erythritol kinase n=1 Tax=Dysgonomonas sp. Marseille-P4677 TaxID=2364790 RepID=UPI00191153C4|nr:4-(cytidine 5'-diphospho)-2-C-methyl-D-erythritol kinase [Dysgonomonas sp. Marseille-P4677]MBK5722026.1 4-(cytidine 5'-diphospho)-2-C-methyl-D-erythritol kinase [Dysgonomonas sp. Marseille-P4677]
MICFPNAKINLGLNVVSKRSDGYHNLETVFYPINVKDALEIIVKKDQSKDTFIEAGIKVDSPPEGNLVMKALRLMREYYDFPSVEVHLLKKIPFGAGIGGGSADASFMLKLLNKTFELNVSDDELISLAVRLGADCPFFIYNQPVFARGIGEVLEKISLSLKDFHFVLIKPDIHVSTKDAFSLINPQLPKNSLKEIVEQPICSWKDLMVNDFEKSVFTKYPIIGEIKDDLYKRGAVYASMSGSGSSVFGIFKEDLKDIESLYSGCFTWTGLGL